jgi:hypothetical protein
VRVNRGLLGWGVFFVVTGAVPLAVRNGVVDAARLDGAFALWPLLLVGIGLGLVLARTRAALVGNLVVGATLGLMAGALLAGASTTGLAVGTCGIGSGSGSGDAFETRSGTFTRAADVTLEMRCGEVEGQVVAGSAWQVAGSAGQGLAPTVSAADGRLRVTAPERTGITIGTEPARWTVDLPDAVDMNLDVGVDAGSAALALDAARVTRLGVEVNAGDARVGLRDDASLRSVNASVNAGSLTLDMPAAGWRGVLSVNAGSAELCLPAGTAVRVHAGDVSLGSTNLAQRGLVQVGSTWSTPGLNAAGTVVELDLSVNLGSFTLDPEHGCG